MTGFEKERGEAVAWRFNLDGMWFVASKRETCQKELEAARLTAEIEPLYTHPTPDAGRVTEMEKKLSEQRRISVELNGQCVDYCRRIAALESQLAESREREGRMRGVLEAIVEGRVQRVSIDLYNKVIAALAADKEGE